VTETELDWMRALSQLEKAEADVYYGWIDVRDRTAQSLSITVPLSLLGVIIGWYGMAVGLGLASLVFVCGTSLWAVKFRVSSFRRWPWNPVRYKHLEKTSPK